MLDIIKIKIELDLTGSDREKILFKAHKEMESFGHGELKLVYRNGQLVSIEPKTPIMFGNTSKAQYGK